MSDPKPSVMPTQRDQLIQTLILGELIARPGEGPLARPAVVAVAIQPKRHSWRNRRGGISPAQKHQRHG